MNKILFPFAVLAIALSVALIIILQKVAVTVDDEDEVYGV